MKTEIVAIDEPFVELDANDLQAKMKEVFQLIEKGFDQSSNSKIEEK